MRAQLLRLGAMAAECAPVWSKAFKDIFFPIFCKECGVRLLTDENGFFCPDCWEGSPRITRPFCTGCGKPHQRMVGFGALTNFPCAACRERPNKHIGRVFAPALYDGAIARAVKLLKFHGKEPLAAALAEVMAEFAREELPVMDYDLLAPVPLHKVRLRARGFNQARLIAQALLPSFPGAALDESLRRIRPTRTQSKLRGKHRTSNVRGAFAVIGDGCTGKRVLLIDDVVTTMGTVNECAGALRRGGASRVDVFAVALTEKPWDQQG